MSKRSGNCLCLRLACHARHSQIDFDEIEQMADKAILMPDRHDFSVYYMSLPQDFDIASAHRILSALATKPYIDEAWFEGSATPLMPRF